MKTKEISTYNNVDNILTARALGVDANNDAVLIPLSALTYATNIRKTYVSYSAMIADITPIASDGTAIEIGQLVAVVDEIDNTDNGIYIRIANGWSLLCGFNYELTQSMGQEVNVAMSQKAVTDELVNLYGRFLVDYSNSIKRVAGPVYMATNGQIKTSSVSVRAVFYFPVTAGDKVHFATSNKNGSNVYSAVISVTSDTTPVVDSPVLEYKNYGTVASVDDYYTVQNTGTFCFYIYVLADQNYTIEKAVNIEFEDNKINANSDDIKSLQKDISLANDKGISFSGTTVKNGTIYGIEGLSLLKNKRYKLTFIPAANMANSAGSSLTTDGYFNLKFVDENNDTLAKIDGITSAAANEPIEVIFAPTQNYTNAKCGSYFTYMAAAVNYTLSVECLTNDERMTDITSHWNNERSEMLRNNICGNANFRAFFFSDIHGNNTELQRIRRLAQCWGKSYVKCIIDGGDDVTSYNTDGSIDAINENFAKFKIPVIRCVGNHDSWATNGWSWDTLSNIYNVITGPAIAQITAAGGDPQQPSDVQTTYENYYYIDLNGVRVIVLHCLGMGATPEYFDNTQLLWFREVLADAVTNSKPVICVNHGPISKDNSVSLDNNWDTYLDWSNGGIADYQWIRDSALDEIDDFIDAGGKFICWLAGHTHADVLVKSKSQKYEQLCFATSCAKNGTSDGQQPNSVNSVYYDLFNMLTVDTTKNLLKVMRIGFNTNNALQEHQSFCWDYNNRKLIYSK